MAIGPTIENLRKKRAEEAALLQMLYSLPSPEGGFENNTPAELAELQRIGLTGRKAYSDPYQYGMDYGAMRPTEEKMYAAENVPQSAEYYARGVSRDLLGNRATNDLFGSGRTAPTVVGDLLIGGGLLGAIGAKAPLTAWDAGQEAARGNYGKAALGGIVSALEGAGLSELAVGARGLKNVGNIGTYLDESMFNVADTPAPRRSVPSVGQAAADAYRVGDRLSAPSSYRGPQGRPSTFSIPDDGMYDARPISQIEQATREYLDARGMDSSSLQKYAPVNEDRAGLIASAYDMMGNTPNDPATRRAYDAMIQETLDQYNSLRDKGIEFKFLKKGMSDPYSKSPAMGYKDLVENGRLFVYPTDFGFGSNAAFDPSTNPLLRGVGRIGDKSNAVANDAFRAVHDTFGHFGSGNPFFRAAGEERAWQEHARMYSPEARGAMTSETRGQNSWLNYGPYGPQNRTAKTEDTIFADQKAGLLSPWAYDVYGMPDPDELEYLRKNMAGWQR